MKVLKNFGLLFLMIFISSAVSNWGNEITENPAIVFIGWIVSSFIYVFADTFSK